MTGWKADEEMFARAADAVRGKEYEIDGFRFEVLEAEVRTGYLVAGNGISNEEALKRKDGLGDWASLWSTHFEPDWTDPHSVAMTLTVRNTATETNTPLFVATGSLNLADQADHVHQPVETARFRSSTEATLRLWGSRAVDLGGSAVADPELRKRHCEATEAFLELVYEAAISHFPDYDLVRAERCVDTGDARGLAEVLLKANLPQKDIQKLAVAALDGEDTSPDAIRALRGFGADIADAMASSIESMFYAPEKMLILGERQARAFIERHKTLIAENIHDFTIILGDQNTRQMRKVLANLGYPLAFFDLRRDGTLPGRDQRERSAS